ncbi:HAD family hydrolase [Pleomorphomonas sp. PLEO]|uniref:HAD family hydrolase n=1 Tax=Pleomorphomonas sp. PLEO TaxID=3239306 RepID=UPI00351F235E
MNWDSIRLVVFDVDGTLYDQKSLRLRMLTDLVSHTLASRSLTTLRVLRAYRQLREKIGDEEVQDFDDILLDRTSQKARIDKAKIAALVHEWMERRPLAHIGACLCPHIEDLFVALKRRDKLIGVFSDYPAEDKLRAMGLKADFIVSATDAGVGILKPNPRGLEVIMAAACVGPQETIMIGDRADRDGEAARRAGVAALIRSGKPLVGWSSFSDYAAPQFSSLFVAE